jgi:hypothetical protein
LRRLALDGEDMGISSEESGRPSGLPALPQSASGWSSWWLPWFLPFGSIAALSAGSSGSLLCAGGVGVVARMSRVRVPSLTPKPEGVCWFSAAPVARRHSRRLASRLRAVLSRQAAAEVAAYTRGSEGPAACPWAECSQVKSSVLRNFPRPFPSRQIPTRIPSVKDFRNAATDSSGTAENKTPTPAPENQPA